MSDYAEFIDAKMHSGADSGFDPISLPKQMFGFQEALTTWALRKGRAAIYADCGLGKSVQQLAWADNVVRKTNRHVLVLTPLAVTFQTANEATKFDLCAIRSQDGKLPAQASVVLTNYERLHYFNPHDFAGVVCDESGILKNFEGATRQAITDFMRKTPYRLLCTATAAPNDYIELGTSSEALGYLGYTDMLTKFFRNAQNTVKPMRYTGFGNPRGIPFGGEHTDKWRFKGHAELAFWRWVCSWARAIRKPSDMGFPDDGFILPPLTETEHLVETKTKAPGMLFTMPAIGLAEQREERKRTVQERCEMAASLVSGTGKPAIVWCHLNAEGDLLESLIPDCVQVSGKNSDEEKEEAFLAFIRGEVRVLVTKPVVGAWGLNLQHCSHATFFPSNSFEQHYQAIRRCWRFGQKNPVHCDMITSEGEKGVLANLQRKAAMADQMFANLIREMHQGMALERRAASAAETEIPSWL